MVTMILDKTALHNAINEYIKKNFGENLALKEFKIKYLKGTNGGDYKVEAKVNSNAGGEA